MGIIGGYNTIIWGTIMLAIGGYQGFKMETSFAKTLYTRQEEPSPPANSEEDMLDEHFLVGAMNGRVHYKYRYSESLFASFL